MRQKWDKIYKCALKENILQLWGYSTKNSTYNCWGPTICKLMYNFFRAHQAAQGLAISMSYSLIEKKGHRWVEREPALQSQRWPGLNKMHKLWWETLWWKELIMEGFLEELHLSCALGKKLVELGWQREEVYFRDHGTSKAWNHVCWQPNLHGAEGPRRDWQVIDRFLVLFMWLGHRRINTCFPWNQSRV